MMKKFLCLSFFSAAALFAENPLIQRILILPYDQGDIEYDQAAIEEDLESPDPINIRIFNGADGLKESLKPYLGEQITEENLQNIRKSIESYFVAENDSLILVEIPEQKITAGCVIFKVQCSRVNAVSVSGNRWFSSGRIQKVLGISEGETVQENDLLNAAAWMNRNPFIHTDVVLSPADVQSKDVKSKDVTCKDVKNKTNIEILVKDRFPVRVYAGTDNTGNSFSGDERFFAGTNFCLGVSNILSYQFTSSYDFPEFLSHFGNLSIFLPWKHELVFYGVYATIHPDIADFDSKGKDIQASMRYIVPFKPLYTPFQHQVLWGADYKQTNSSLFFLGALPDGTILRVPVNQQTADLFQFYLAYQLENAWDKKNMTFKIETLFSPFKFLPHQTQFDYDSLRLGADIRYFYSRVAIGQVYHFPNELSVAGLLRAQVASGALLPSEQFGLGGYDTVRGYQERVYLADNTVLGNFEIRTRTYSFFRSKIDSLIFLAFLDAAYGHNWHASPAFPKDAWLMGTGAGMRYNIWPYLTTRLDYGFRIHNTSFGNDQIGRVHFSAILSY